MGEARPYAPAPPRLPPRPVRSSPPARRRRGRGRTVLDFAFAYLLAHEPVASVIAGATKPSQVHANVAAAGWTLSPGDLDAVDEALAQAA